MNFNISDVATKFTNPSFRARRALIFIPRGVGVIGMRVHMIVDP